MVPKSSNPCAVDKQLLIDSLADHAVVMLDSGGLMLSWSAGARRLLGYKAEEVIGEHYSIFARLKDRDRGFHDMVLAKAWHLGSFEQDAWRLRNDSTLFWANVVINPIKDRADSPIGFVMISRDITQRRVAELDRRASEQSLRLLVENVFDYAIYMLDPRGHVSSWNAKAERFKGYTADEIIGQHFSRFYSEEDQRSGIPALALNTADQEGRFEADGWRVRKDGSRFWASVIIDRIQSEEGKVIGFAKVTRDISEKRKNDEQLHLSQKMEAIGQLTGGLAHDFNNLLTTISGNLEVMQGKVVRDRTFEIDRYIAAAQAAATRASSLTHRLLSFSRRQTLNPKPTDLNRLLSHMEMLVHRKVGLNIDVEVVRGYNLWSILIDKSQLESALLNLCINARDAMPNGGKLTIKTDNMSFDVGSAKGQDVDAGHYVRVRIFDTGFGMTPDVAKKAFDPFFTTKPLGEGTGLGLSMVYGFARQSGGQVTVDSEPGQGTTISLYLPRYIEEKIPLNKMILSGELKTDDDDQVVLVIDDEAMVRTLIAEVLTERGYKVLEATTGSAGLNMLMSNAQIDLLITNVGLPGGLNGRQVADAARIVRPSLKVLFITGYAESAAIGSGNLQSGMFVLTKPFQMAFLADRTREITASL